MKSFFKWFLLFNKRLYKKPTFLILLLIIPIAIFSFSLVSDNQAGFVHVAIVNEGKTKIGNEITDNLIKNTSIINYTVYKDEQSANHDMALNKVDMIWVFPEDIESKIKTFAKNPDEDNYIVKVTIKENDLKTKLSLEKLTGALYPYLSKQFYLNRAKNSDRYDLSGVQDKKIEGYYDNYLNTDKLFVFGYPEKAAVHKTDVNYLTSPVRGFLSVVVVLCGFSSAIMFLNDDKKGVFAKYSAQKKILVSLSMQFVAIINLGILAFLSLFILNINVGFLRELLIFAIFIINATLFCTLLQQLINNLAVFIPVSTSLTVLQMLVCPVFFNFKAQRIPQAVFPSTYYINSAFSNNYLIYSLIYGIVLSLILAVIYFKKRKI